MSDTPLYFDDPEGNALSKETSHPEFVRLMTADFYYDCLDEFSPFGNDDGADLLFNLEDWYREDGEGNITEWLFETIDEFGFKYQSKDCARIVDKASLEQIHSEDPFFFECMDDAIIAAAFGQLKITGLLDQELKGLALIALERKKAMSIFDTGESEIDEEDQKKIDRMAEDLRQVN